MLRVGTVCYERFDCSFGIVYAHTHAFELQLTRTPRRTTWYVSLGTARVSAASLHTCATWCALELNASWNIPALYLKRDGLLAIQMDTTPFVDGSHCRASGTLNRERDASQVGFPGAAMRCAPSHNEPPNSTSSIILLSPRTGWSIHGPWWLCFVCYNTTDSSA